jgi:hypothetical protein
MRLIIIAMALTALAACSVDVRGPRVGVTPPQVVIGPDGGHGTFCPPGQAKKGMNRAGFPGGHFV